jgi:hypothetical protein
VDNTSAPRAAKPLAISTTPVLSETLISARAMLAMMNSFNYGYRVGGITMDEKTP